MSSIEVDDLRYRIIIIPQDSIFFLWMNLKIIIQLFINLYIFKTSRTSRRRNLRVFKNVYLLGSSESNQVFTFPGGNNNDLTIWIPMRKCIYFCCTINLNYVAVTNILLITFIIKLLYYKIYTVHNNNIIMKIKWKLL